MIQPSNLLSFKSPYNTTSNTWKIFNYKRDTSKRWQIYDYLYINDSFPYDVISEVKEIESLPVPGTPIFARHYKCPSLVNASTVSWAINNPYGPHYFLPLIYSILITDFVIYYKDSDYKSSRIDVYQFVDYQGNLEDGITNTDLRSFVVEDLVKGGRSYNDWSEIIISYFNATHSKEFIDTYKNFISRLPIEVQSISKRIKIGSLLAPDPFKGVDLSWVPKNHPDYIKMSIMMAYIRTIVSSIKKKFLLSPIQSIPSSPIYNSLYVNRVNRALSQPDISILKKNTSDVSIGHKKLFIELKEDKYTDEFIAHLSLSYSEIKIHTVESNFVKKSIPQNEVYIPKVKTYLKIEKAQKVEPDNRATDIFTLPKVSNLNWEYFSTSSPKQDIFEYRINEIGPIPIEFEDYSHVLHCSIRTENVTLGSNVVEQVVHNLNNWLLSLPSPIVIYESFEGNVSGRIVKSIDPSDLRIRLTGHESLDYVAIEALDLLSDYLIPEPTQVKSHFPSRHISRSSFILPKFSFKESIKVYSIPRDIYLGQKMT